MDTNQLAGGRVLAPNTDMSEVMAHHKLKHTRVD